MPKNSKYASLFFGHKFQYDKKLSDNDKAYDKKDVRQLVDDPRQNYVPGKAWERKISHVPGTVWTHKPGCRHS